MASQEYPTLNGIAPSWADINTSFSISGGSILDTADYSAIKWDRSIEVGEQRGASGGRVLKRTTGSLKQNASVTLYAAGYQALVEAIEDRAVQLGFVRGNVVQLGLVHFDILIQHSPPGAAAAEIIKRKIKGCRIIGDSADHKEGSDADTIEVSLSVAEVVLLSKTGRELGLL